MPGEIKDVLGDVSRLPPATGRALGSQHKPLTGQVLMRPVYPTRPPGALDFIVDNVLTSGGLPLFNVEADILRYTAPDGYIAIVTALNWYVTPQNNAIDPAQLSMRLSVGGAVLQGTDNMGVGQSGSLTDMYIPVKAGADITVRLGRGPGVVRYQAATMKALRANLDPSGFTVDAESASGAENLLASLNGVLYQYDGTNIWKSYDGITFTNISTPGFTALGNRWLFTFKNYLCYSDQTSFYYSINGIVWSTANTALPGATSIGWFFEFKGKVWGWNPLTQTFYVSDDIGQTWTAQPVSGLGQDLSTFSYTYRCASLNGVLYAIRGDGSANMTVYKTVDGVYWTLVKDSATIDGSVAWDTRVGFAFVTFNNTFYLAGGYGSTHYRQLYSSADALNWTNISTVNNPRGYMSATVSSGLGFVLHGYRDSAGTTPNNALYGVGLFPAIYDPELRCYCQIKGQLIKSKGSVEETLVNPL